MSNITIEIAPIEEANDAILDGIKEHFLPELGSEFISTQIETDISNYLENFKEDLYCVIEFPYVDKVYRDSYYNYYSSKHYSYPRDCIRVSLFESAVKEADFLNPKKHLSLNKKYLGFFILRPTTNALFGRSLINPKAFENSDYKICLCKASNLVYGAKLEGEGFPHSSQDGETIKCAETTIWAIMEYFGNRYAEHKPTLPSKIHKSIESYTYQRQLPSIGLSMEEISYALKEFGFGTRIYSFTYYGKNLYKIIDCYVESGIPVILGLDTGNTGHVVIAMGKKNTTKTLAAVPKSKKTAWGRNMTYIDSSSIPAKYVVQDDNKEPYKVVSLDKPGSHYKGECASYKIDSIVVPLYPKIYLEAVVAKRLALEILVDSNVGYDFGNDFVFRFFLTSSRSFKNHVAQLDKMDKVLKSNILITKMPKFIWCSEIYTQKSFQSAEKQAVGLIVLDATEANNESVDSLIFAGYPDRIITVNENNFVSLRHKFEKYQFYNNLK